MDYRTRIYETYASRFQRSESRFDTAAADRKAATFAHYFRGWLPPDKNAAIADLACGNGHLLHFFKQRGYQRIGGVDISAEQVRLSRQVVPDVAEESVLDYLRARPDTFDLLTGIDIVEHMRKDEAIEFLDGCHAALRSGGRLILQTPNADSPIIGNIRYGDFTHEICLNRSSLGSLLDLAGFRETEAREAGPPRGHSAAATVRSVLWQGYRLGIMAWNLIETGSPGSGCYTRVFLMTGRKA